MFGFIMSLIKISIILIIVAVIYYYVLYPEKGVDVLKGLIVDINKDFKKHSFEKDGQLYYYLEAGLPINSGPTILCIPGFGDDKYSVLQGPINRIYPSLKNKYNFISLDLPGFGELSSQQYTVTTQDMAEFVNKFVSALDIKQVIPYGLSMGGGIAFMYNLLYPERIIKTMIYNPFIPADFSHRETLFEEIYTRSNFNPFVVENECQNSLLGLLTADKWAYPPDDYPWPIRQLLYRFNSKFKTSIENQLKSLIDFSYKVKIEDFDKIKNPILLIYGTNDKVIPIEVYENIIRNRQNTTSVKLEGGSHCCNLAKPQFTDLILNGFNTFLA
jgi:pimeloyl-ACP methyl ester carboxylesterase